MSKLCFSERVKKEDTLEMLRIVGEDRESIRKWWRERKDSNSNHDWVNSNPFLLFLRDKREIKVLAVSFLFPHKTRSYTRTGYTENWKCSWKQSHYFAFSTDTYFKIIDIIEPEWIFSTDRLFVKYIIERKKNYVWIRYDSIDRIR